MATTLDPTALRVALKLRSSNEHGGKWTFCVVCGHLTQNNWWCGECYDNGMDSGSAEKVARFFGHPLQWVFDNVPEPPRFNLTLEEEEVLGLVRLHET